MDPVLHAFSSAPDGDADEALGRLLAIHVAPILRRVAAVRLRQHSGDVEDVCSHVTLQLMLRLRQGRQDGDLDSIDALDRYTATAAHHGCDHYLRRKYPLRWQLRNRVRYALEHDSFWSLWRSPEGTWLCGRAGWESRSVAEAPSAKDLADVAAGQVRRLLTRIFPEQGAPLPLWVVVDIAADAWGIPLRPHAGDAAIDSLVDTRARVDVEMTQRAQAARVWTEICALPVRQRQALLLNLKDDGLSLFLATGTASFRTVAEVLEMTAAALAALWNDLPLPDQAVATLLGCTRQQVINLRMSARKRLSNRLSGWS